VSLNFAHFLSA